MRKLCLRFLCVMFLVPLVVQSQWSYVKTIFYFSPSLPHGVAVSPDGNIWICFNGRTGDSLGGRALANVTVLKPDGSPASFSPIRTLTIAGVIDTLYRRPDGARGIALDHQGNILLCFRDYMYRINYKTGAGMNKAIPRVGTTLTQPGATSGGDIIVGHVSNGLPVYVYDKDFNLVGTVIDQSPALSRNVGVSSDGKDVYHCPIAGAGILRYHCDDGTLGPYALKDTLAKITYAESFQWSRKNPDILWTSATQTANQFTKNTWYAINVKTKALVDSMKWKTGMIDSLGTPRGIAFSVTEDTAYIVGFDGHSVQMFKKGAPVSVERDDDAVVKGYRLSQNYPNPFNPSTTIQFTLDQPSMTTLKVFDVLGREVATLVNDNLGAGVYNVIFEAGNIPSGTYFYMLRAGGRVLSKKMMLVK